MKIIRLMTVSVALTASLLSCSAANALQVSPELLIVDANPRHSLEVAAARLKGLDGLTPVVDDDILEANLLGAQAASNLGLRKLAATYVAASVQIATRQQDLFGLALLLTIQASALSDLGSQDKAIAAARAAIAQALKLPDEVSQAYVREAAAWTLSSVSLFSEAESHFTYALAVYQKKSLAVRAAAAQAGMATVYNGLQDAQASTLARKRAYENLAAQDAPYLKSVLSWALGQDAINARDAQEAKIRFQQSLKESRQTNDTAGAAAANVGLALAAVMREDWAAAEALLVQAQPVLHAHEYLSLWALGQALRARAWVGLGRPGFEALLESEFQKNSHSTDSFSKLRILEYNAETYLAAGQAAKGAGTLQEVLAMDRRLSKLARKTQLNELGMRFEVGQKELENRTLRLENDLNKAALKNETDNQRLLALMLALALMTLMFGAYLLFSQTQKKKHYARLAFEDFLTGAPNRRAALDVIQEMRAEAYPGLIMMIDLDFFKRVNDRFGHHVGDNVLKAFYQAAILNAPHGEFVGRLGGEEWIITSRSLHADAACAIEIFTRVRGNLQAMIIEGFPASEKVAFSMGVHRMGAGETMASILAAADRVLYLAKNNGRDRFIVDITADKSCSSGKRD